VGVWRVASGGRSAVLKHLACRGNATPTWPSDADPASPHWWRREVDAYASGLPGVPFALPDVRVFERADGTVALWLEDVGDLPARRPEDLSEIARLLAAMPRAVRGTSGFLRRYLELRADRVPAASDIWGRREAILARLDAVPQVVVHNDFHPANVYRRDGRWYAIDWAFCGAGPLGTDAGVLVADGLYDGFVPLERADETIDAVWRSYSQALDPSLVDHAAVGFFAGTALRYAWTAGWTDEAAHVHAALVRAVGTRLPSVL
jgi:Ser/Thr protein kinase RdoA (MazF antagonist)